MKQHEFYAELNYISGLRLRGATIIAVPNPLDNKVRIMLVINNDMRIVLQVCTRYRRHDSKTTTAARVGSAMKKYQRWFDEYLLLRGVIYDIPVR